MRHLFRVACLMFLLPLLAQAKEGQTFQTFGDYKVVYTVFNSSFIQPDVAKAYGITRAANQVLINIALIKSTAAGDSEGLPAEVSGTATNLMQQQKTLNFFTVREQSATYFLAPLRFDNEEILNFNIRVKASADAVPFDLKFTKMLYVDK